MSILTKARAYLSPTSAHKKNDQGASITEYGALLLLVALIAGTILASGIDNIISGRLGGVVISIFSGTEPAPESEES
ncbi:hypothetical protein [Nocardiopsis sp. CNT312]|uniref:hypothetical protein n=1 Tax=Nocardiopsis sp. CNT312 TaxID=1137268 RepID=UPI0004B196DD|nr:hypothetical protein [Nocardiopsis sp. CNT312]